MLKSRQSRKMVENIDYLKEGFRPVLRCSICNGEQVAGFKDVQTGTFHEVMLIRDDKELDAFMEKYNISFISKEY